MADMTMCLGKGCPVKHRCYRALASPAIRQAYSNFDEMRDGASCAMFWDVSGDELQDNGFPLVTEGEDK